MVWEIVDSRTGLVVNTILWDGESVYKVSENHTLRKIDDVLDEEGE